MIAFVGNIHQKLPISENRFEEATKHVLIERELQILVHVGRTLCQKERANY
jgi:hypothetical protein